MKRFALILGTFMAVVWLADRALLPQQGYQPEALQGVEVKPESLCYFPDNYVQSRERFRQLHTLAPPRYRVQEGLFKVPSADEDLTVDWLHLRSDAPRLVVLVSGVHGMEAPTGAAMQQLFVDMLRAGQLPGDFDVLMLHALNPYGFKYGRRATENNVDLNRNLDTNAALFGSDNQGYRRLRDFLLPQTPVNLGQWENRFFAERLSLQLLHDSRDAIQEAALSGQYQYPQGFYYGGDSFEPQQAFLQQLLTDKAAPYQSILFIDLHTGFGTRGETHFYPGNPATEQIKRDMAWVFQDYEMVWPSKASGFFPIRGDLVGFAGKLLAAEKRFVPIILEFGTMDSLATKGGVESLHRTMLENQGHFHGFQSAQDRAEVQRRYQEMFYPSSGRWRSTIVRDMIRIYPQVLERFQQLDGVRLETGHLNTTAMDSGH
ncbi:Zinc carboxypeptidase [Microbulbifer aggregans]|uniref:Zinc carboxypeptidase n=1 Tax=Microbulbifer aggregans TaxID=1769779 RepID=A0A1C9W4Z6_9GAMM|nr:M14 family metallopeptidase [Microbulbifer aggregans]AOS96200.1 Zinc carboxypeptidase [Microbulbifer aggregans]